MDEKNNTNQEYQPDVLSPEKEGSEREFQKELGKPAEKKPIGTLEIKADISEEMPLTYYEELNRIPIGATYLELESLWNSNIDNLQQKVSELDDWVKKQIYSQGYKNTIGSYNEIVENACKELNLSPNLHRMEKLNRLYTYFKVLSNKKSKKK